VFSWVLDVRQSVESKKFRCTTQFSAFCIQILFEVLLLLFKFFFSARTVLLIVVRVVNVYYEVDAEVKFEFLGLEILFQALFSWLQ
jgi:hypothetical protein